MHFFFLWYIAACFWNVRTVELSLMNVWQAKCFVSGCCSLFCRYEKVTREKGEDRSVTSTHPVKGCTSANTSREGIVVMPTASGLITWWTGRCWRSWGSTDWAGTWRKTSRTSATTSTAGRSTGCEVNTVYILVNRIVRNKEASQGRRSYLQPLCLTTENALHFPFQTLSVFFT